MLTKKPKNTVAQGKKDLKELNIYELLIITRWIPSQNCGRTEKWSCGSDSIYFKIASTIGEQTWKTEKYLYSGEKEQPDKYSFLYYWNNVQGFWTHFPSIYRLNFVC